MYQINENQAIVQTVDFFTPIVDDPYLFGQIAAANAFSDLYAMGARPMTALNIVAFPINCVETGVLRAVLEGGISKIKEAGACLLGGHTVEDKEPKYGMCVTGIVHPKCIWSNAGAKEGDYLILTKALGTGIIASGAKGDLVDEQTLNLYHEQMTRLNKDAAEIVSQYNVRGVTDITGFGLLGHAYEMAKASGVTLKLTAEAVPLLPQVIELAEMGFLTAGGYTNQAYLQDHISFNSKVPEIMQEIFFDPQTSGGLLIAVSPDILPQIIESFKIKQVFARVIGKVMAKHPDYAYDIVVE